MRLPSTITDDLAYLSGFILGDGHICVRKDKSEYHIICTGNLLDEQIFYKTVIIPLFKNLFDIDLKIKIDKSNNTFGVIYYSKELVNYFVNRLGIPSGAKCSRIKIPEAFKTDEAFTKSLIQGFADADFCLSLKRRNTAVGYYPVIEGASRSKEIISEVGDFLKIKKIPFYIELDKLKFDKRLNKSIQMSSIYIYGHNNLILWMKEIGFRNPKILSKFEIWKKVNANNLRARFALESIAGDGVSSNHISRF